MTSLSSLTSPLVLRSVSAEPASGSDIDTATTISPRQTAGTTRRFSASDPKCSMARTGPTDDSKMGKATAEEIFANSSRTISASRRSEEHTSELQSLMRISYDVFCLRKKTDSNIKIKTFAQTHLHLP